VRPRFGYLQYTPTSHSSLRSPNVLLQETRLRRKVIKCARRGGIYNGRFTVKLILRALMSFLVDLNETALPKCTATGWDLHQMLGVQQEHL